MTRAELVPARSAMSEMRVSQRPRSLITSTAAWRIWVCRASDKRRRFVMTALTAWLADGPLLSGLARRSFAEALRRRRVEEPRRDRALLEEGRGGHAEVGRVAPESGRRPRPAADGCATEARFDQLVRRRGSGPEGLAV